MQFKSQFEMKKVAKQNKVVLNINILYTFFKLITRGPQFVYIGGVFCKF